MSNVIQFLQEMIRIPSLTGSVEEQQAGHRMVAEMQAIGFDAAWQDQSGNAIGLYRGHTPGPAWLLLTHLDIVNVGDRALWKHPPYEAVIEEGFVHGRGSVDIKGPLAAQIYAVEALIRAGERPLHDVVVLAATAEETSGVGAEAFVERLPLRLPSGEAIEIGACIVGEPSSNRVMLGHRGVARMIMKFQGRAHHASRAIAEANPYFALGTFLERLSEARLRNHPVLGVSTIAPTMILADTQSQNVTPNIIELILDWRFSSESQAEMQATLDELAQGLNVSFTVYPTWKTGPIDPRLAGPTGQNSPGFFIEGDHALVGILQNALKSVRSDAPEPGLWRFATDGRYFFNAGIPTIGFGPGDENLAHTTKEAIALREIEENMAVLIKILRGKMF